MYKTISFILFNLFFCVSLFSQNTPMLQFSPIPFSGQPKVSEYFEWGTPIYGKLTMPKPLKSYAKDLDNYDAGQIAEKDKYKKALSFMVCPSTEDVNDRTYALMQLVVSQQELEGRTVPFDVMPSPENASSFFFTGFYAELAKSKLITYDPSEGTSSGTKTEFNFYIYERDIPYGADETIASDAIKIANTVYRHIGKLTIDFTTVKDVREVMQWHDDSRAITESVAEKFKTK
jgi:hypothetical protein